jgi:mRNA interferase MazF
VKSKKGQIALDQIRTIDKIRIKNKLSVLKEKEQEEVFGILNEMFRK